MCVNDLKNNILQGEYSIEFSYLYGDNANEAVKRFSELSDNFINAFSNERNAELFSAPGRTEIIGNHTDHQHGCVIAQAVDLDIAGVVSKNDDNIIRIHSAGYAPNEVSLESLEPTEKEKGTSEGIIRGIAYALKKFGFYIGGFDAVTASFVPGGSGLSSSAAFEVFIGTVLNEYYNDGIISPQTIAKAGQSAENLHFGKPSGLMDQMACAMGGINYIDFNKPTEPDIIPIDFDFNKSGYCLCIVKTGSSHADLTDDYASIPTEMKKAAKICGCEYMRDVDTVVLFEKLNEIREKAGDRAVLRALNFIDENTRVTVAKEALESGDMTSFKRLILQSGYGSYMYLQNVIPSGESENQGLALALSVSEHLLKGRGAWRVHGGGFAGTIQAFVPKDLVSEYKGIMEEVFGNGACMTVGARFFGGHRIMKNAQKNQ